MRGIIRLAIVAALLYLGYTQGKPWLDRLQQANESEAAGRERDLASADCVALARSAAETLGSELIPLAAPRMDRGTWGTALIRTGGALSDADDACRCGTDSCLEASLAINEMRRVVDALNNAVRGSAPPMTNPANSLERIYRHLDEADRLSRG